MEKRKPKIIRDNKKRGEWAELVFAARAAENGLPVSKPSGESRSFGYVVGHPGKFVAVQMKCTIALLPNGRRPRRGQPLPHRFHDQSAHRTHERNCCVRGRRHFPRNGFPHNRE
jgi:hypothetical protein